MAKYMRLLRSAGSLGRTKPSSGRSYHDHAEVKPNWQVAIEHRATLNDLPVPSGSWSEAYGATQQKKNIFLAASIAFFTVSFGLAVNNGIFFLNWVPDYKNVQVGHTLPRREED